MTTEPLGPFVIDGIRYYHLERAAQIIEAVTPVTLGRWAEKGVTPFGFDLGAVRHPLFRTGHEKPRSNRRFRLLLPEAKVMALKQLLHDHPLPRGLPGRPLLEDLRRAARLYESRSVISPNP